MTQKKRSNYPSKRRPQSDQVPDAYGFEYAGFVASHLTPALKQQFRDIKPDWERLLSWFVEKANDGYKLSLEPNNGGTGFKARMFDMDTSRDTNGFILAGEASLPEQALSLLWFKDTVMFQDGWHLGISDPEKDDDWLK